MTSEPTTVTPADPQEAAGLLPVPGGWTTTEDLARSTGRSHHDAEQLLRRAAVNGLLVDGTLIKGAPGTWHRPGGAVLADHRVVAGPCGAGKTTALRAFLATEHWRPAVSSWVCAPLGRLASAPDAPYEQYAVGHQAAVDLLSMARDLISHRSTCTACGHHLTVVTVDDAHLLLMHDPRAVHLLEGIALLGPRLGVVPRVAVAVNRIDVMGSALLWRNLNHPA
jgi:hypothetical protein